MFRRRRGVAAASAEIDSSDWSWRASGIIRVVFEDRVDWMSV